jgi:hypothetical protein
VIKPAYSVFLLSINIFVWQNVLYFPNEPHICDLSGDSMLLIFLLQSNLTLNNIVTENCIVIFLPFGR